jgi:hypothetical protein
MGGMYGADVEQLRALAAQFDRSADRLDADRVSVGNEIRVRAWVGPVAVRFRAQWDSDHSRRVHDAAQRLRDAALSLRANADDQARTSAVGGGSSRGASAGGGTSTRVPSASAEPSDVAAWWKSLTPEQQADFIRKNPDAIGALDGLPGGVRDEANRAVLERELDEIRSQPCPADPEQAKIYLDKLKALEQLEDVVKTNKDAQILMIDTSTYPVKAAVSLGDVDTADHISVFTQGVSSQVGKDGGLTGPVSDALNLKKETLAQLALAGKSDETVASVVWMGYEAPPNIPAGVLPGYGETGGAALAQFGDGLRANSANAHITALGHSYGSYVSGVAVQQTDAFDSFVAFGSPGVGTNDVNDLLVDAGRFYTMEANGWFGAWDPVADTGVHGGDPSFIDGAVALSADGTGDLLDSDGHSEYLKDRSTSQRNMALIVAGLDEKVIKQ